MARHNLGKKINENGTLEDLGNTISDEDLDYIDHTSNYLEWTKSRTISGTYTTIELFKVAPKSLSSKYFVSAEVTTNDGYDFTLIVYDGVAKITKDVDGKLYSKENTNSMFSYPPQLGVYFGYDYVKAMFKTTGAWVKVKVSAIGCWEDDRSYVNIETLYSGIQAGYTLPTWTRVANESNLVISASLQNLLSKSGGTITGNLEVNGNLTKNGVNVATIQDIPSTENFIQKENPVGTGSLSLNRKEDTSIGNYSTAIGKNTTASAEASFAEGDNTQALGFSDHAEGRNTLAQGGNGAHAEGYQTQALWAAAHAEGMYTEARGACSHSSGYKTVALSQSQFVFGEWNEKDPSGATTGYKGTYVEIVGNGTAEDDRSNARTLDWDGNETLAGTLYVNGDKEVATKEYVDVKIPTDYMTTNTQQYIDGYKIFRGGVGIGDSSDLKWRIATASDGSLYLMNGTGSLTYSNMFSFLPDGRIGEYNRNTGLTTTFARFEDGVVLSEIALGPTEVGTPLDNYYTKAEILDALYPVGTIYLTTSTNGVGSSSPASWLGGTWERLPEGYALWTASSGAGGTIEAGLPNITGTATLGCQFDNATGAWYAVSSASNGRNGSNATRHNIAFDASRSNDIYGKSTTVQPPAYRVYAWRRTA